MFPVWETEPQPGAVFLQGCRVPSMSPKGASESKMPKLEGWPAANRRENHGQKGFRIRIW